MRRARGFAPAVLALLCAARAFPQRNLAGAIETQLALDRLNVTGSALMIAAHPDDENTALLAWLARGRKVRTGYLSITRGEGGQNLIGPEQGSLLGLIRTQELLAARRIDGAQQFFTRAVDFGYTKTIEETFAKWDREKTLGDVVWVIRKFRPDVIILRFSGTARDGHGQHQASAILGKDAFDAAADPRRFPEQLKSVKPWRARRVMWNASSFTREQDQEAAKLPGRLEVDLGEFNPLLGYSYSEIAGMSRSEHESQGMGSPEGRGSVKNYLVPVAGEPPASDLFDGVSMGWSGPEAEPLRRAAATFDGRHPEETVPLLIKARQTLPEERRSELDEAIGLCAGLWLDASTDRATAAPGTVVKITLQVLNRSHVPVELISTSLGKPDAGILPYNLPVTATVNWTAVRTASEPLREKPEYDPVLNARFTLRVQGQEISIVRPVWHRYVDTVRGELIRPFVVVPPVSVKLSEAIWMFPKPASRNVTVQVRSYSPDKLAGSIRLLMGAGWSAKPQSQQFELEQEGQELALEFVVTPPAKPSSSQVRAVATVNGQDVPVGVLTLDYRHIPQQTVFPVAVATLVRADVSVLSRNIGYVMGAGDDVPDALRQIGCDVTLLSEDDLSRSNLSRFDAIVTGVRAYNVRADLRANQHRLEDYVSKGGTLVVQYNVADGSKTLQHIGPYPIRIGRERVSLEEAAVEVLKSDHPLLTSPNKITFQDFGGWVQERGLYFASEWDPKYETVIASHDPGEKPLPGGMLYTRYGKGAYVFTAYSWFRELPAGVPGAYRIFANLLSAGKDPAKTQ